MPGFTGFPEHRSEVPKSAVFFAHHALPHRVLRPHALPHHALRPHALPHHALLPHALPQHV
eukprot:2673323-Alexandrium_andersonii.AAC.1